MTARSLDPFYLIVDHSDWLARLLPLGVKLVQLRVKDRPELGWSGTWDFGRFLDAHLPVWAHSCRLSSRLCRH